MLTVLLCLLVVFLEIGAFVAIIYIKFVLLVEGGVVRWSSYVWQLFSASRSEFWYLISWAAFYSSFVLNARQREQAIALARANQLAHKAQLDMLRYQLNPHFLFNTLNSLSALVFKERNSEAESTLMGLSRFLRYTLDSGSTQLVCLEEDISAQRDYLAIEKVRFQDRLKLNFDIDPALSRALVPSLLLQPIVENAIKHVTAKKNETSEITILARKEKEKLVIKIEDNGPGVADPQSLLKPSQNKVGLKNTAERLQLLYGDSAKLSAANRESGGLCITITLPLQYGI